jgi:uncharacterized protein (DUF58 family)
VAQRRPFPLVPRHALTGMPFGRLPSHRRGPGSEVIGSRAYRPGDPVSTIDWGATARLSAATGRDEFIVRERRADDAPRVALVLDRRPAMTLYPPSSPWLSKPTVVREAVTGVIASALAARAEIGALDFANGEPHWVRPSHVVGREVVQDRLDDPAPAPEDTLARSFRFLALHRRDLPSGSFVFVFSDFLSLADPHGWNEATTHGWDVVPVVVQDPTWEQSFPAVGGVAVPFTDPATGKTSLTRLSRREADARRAANADRAARLTESLSAVGLRPVVLTSSDPFEIDRAFLVWAEERRRGRRSR